MKKLKFLLVSFACLIFLFSFPKTGFAQTATASSNLEASQSSYVLFYPMVAGSTEGDPLYFLKLFRDKLGELFSFSSAQKANFNLQIATKRLLEAEKLFQNNQEGRANNALSKFNTKLASSYDNALKIKNAGILARVTADILQTTQKYDTLLRQLKNNFSIKDKGVLEETIKRTIDIEDKVRQEE